MPLWAHGRRLRNRLPGALPTVPWRPSRRPWWVLRELSGFCMLSPARLAAAAQPRAPRSQQQALHHRPPSAPTPRCAARCDISAIKSCECLKRCKEWSCLKDRKGREVCQGAGLMQGKKNSRGTAQMLVLAGAGSPSWQLILCADHRFRSAGPPTQPPNPQTLATVSGGWGCRQMSNFLPPQSPMTKM